MNEREQRKQRKKENKILKLEFQKHKLNSHKNIPGLVPPPEACLVVLQYTAYLYVCHQNTQIIYTCVCFASVTISLTAVDGKLSKYNTNHVFLPCR